MYREAISHLTNVVCISLRLSLSLAIDTVAIAKTMAIGDTCDDTNIVSTARSNGVSNGKTMSDLSNSVGLSFPLAIVTKMSITVSNTSYNTNIVRVTSSIGIVY